MRGEKSSRRKERDDERRGGQSGELSWRTARCNCCGRVGLWHDDLGQIMKITLPGITTLLRCPLLLLLLLLLELEEDTDIPVCFFQPRRVSHFSSPRSWFASHMSKRGDHQAAGVRINLKEREF